MSVAFSVFIVSAATIFAWICKSPSKRFLVWLAAILLHPSCILAGYFAIVAIESNRHVPDLGYWATIALFTYAIGIGAGITRLLQNHLHLTRLMREASPLSDRKILDVIAKYSSELSLPVIPLAVLSSEIQQPTVFIRRRPVLILPVGTKAILSFEDVASVIAYLLGHIRRLDYIFVPLVELVAVASFYSPLIWVARRKLRNECAMATDDIAVSLIGDRAQFAKTLLKLDELSRMSRRVSAHR